MKLPTEEYVNLNLLDLLRLIKDECTSEQLYEAADEIRSFAEYEEEKERIDRLRDRGVQIP